MKPKFRSPGTGHAIHGLSAVLWVLTVLISLCMFVLPFLSIDRNFRITPELRFANIAAAWDPLMIEAIGNSFMLSVIASIFAIGCGSAVTALLARRPVLTGTLIVLAYCINPVIRALSFGALFSIHTPIQKLMSALAGEWFAQMILLPAIILGAHYLPIYLMRFLFVIRKPTAAHELTGILDLIFVSLPAFLRGFPISFAIFFLLTFFDYWVIQVIGGGKALYWSQMFEQKAFVARDMGQAGMLIILGLCMTLLAYVIALSICSLLRAGLRRVRPLRISRIRVRSFPRMAESLRITVLFALCWPLFYTLIRSVGILAEPERWVLMNGALRAVGATLFVSAAIAVFSTLFAFALSALYREYPARCRWWLPALYFLALVPEAAYVLFSLCVTGLGVLKAGPIWLFVLMTSFSAPMSFFLWESLWGETEERKLWTLAAAMHRNMTGAMELAFREWKKFFGLTFIINFWMTLDNVFITNFSAGPKWKPIAATIFTATKRGFQDAEFLTGTFASLAVILLIVAVGLFTRTKNDPLAS